MTNAILTTSISASTSDSCVSKFKSSTHSYQRKWQYWRFLLQTLDCTVSAGRRYWSLVNTGNDLTVLSRCLDFCSRFGKLHLCNNVSDGWVMNVAWKHDMRWYNVLDFGYCGKVMSCLLLPTYYLYPHYWWSCIEYFIVLMFCESTISHVYNTVALSILEHVLIGKMTVQVKNNTKQTEDFHRGDCCLCPVWNYKSIRLSLVTSFLTMIWRKSDTDVTSTFMLFWKQWFMSFWEMLTIDRLRPVLEIIKSFWGNFKK